jgi:hypothetical protein
VLQRRLLRDDPEQALFVRLRRDLDARFERVVRETPGSTETDRLGVSGAHRDV